jgi:hypothetical protein
MKIVFIGKFDELYHEEGKARGLQKLGHDVYRFDELHTTMRDYVRITHIAPDVVIYTKLRFKDSVQFIKQLLKDGILTVSWFPDYCFDWNEGMLKYNKHMCAMSNSDLILIPDGRNSLKWKSLGLKQYCVRQEIYDDMCYVGTPIPDLNKDVLFIGTVNDAMYKHRVPLIQFLQQTYGNRFLHLGGNNSDTVRNADLNDVIASVKVVIGDSLYAPSYWSNRIYETIGRGGFILHNEIEDLEKEYSVGEHFDTYKVLAKKIGWGREVDYVDLKIKLDLYLNNDELRNNIAASGMNYTKQHYTMTNRCSEVVEIIKSEIRKRTWFNG